MNTFHKLFIAAAIILLATTKVEAERLYSADNFLSSSLINMVHHDHNNIIWVATENGLNSYDGSKFTQHKLDRQTPNSLKHNYVKLIFEDSENRLYIGGFYGLQLYDYASNNFVDVPLLTEDNRDIYSHVLGMLERANGDVLVYTSGQGIFKLSTVDGVVKATITTELTEDNMISFVYEDKNANLWLFAEEEGLIQIDPNNNRLNSFETKHILGSNISCICEDNKGQLLIGTLDNGLFTYNEKTNSFNPIKYKTQLRVKTLFTSRSGKVYIGTDGDGMKVWNPEEKTIKDSDFTATTFNFEKSKVHSIEEDECGNTWLGIFQKGLLLIPADRNKFNYIGYKSVANNTIGSNSVMSVCEDHRGRIWVGTDNDGIYTLDNKGAQLAHFQHNSSDKSSAPSTIMSIFEDSDNNLWVGSYLDGAAKLNTKTGKFTYLESLIDEGSKAQRIYDFSEDKNRNIWIATMGAGVFSVNMDSGEVNQYKGGAKNDYTSTHNILHNNWISSILVSSDNKLYIGTHDGISCMDLDAKNLFSAFIVNRLIGGHVVYTLFEDSKGAIWAGTSEGLICLDKDTHTSVTYTQKDGLSNNIVCGIEEDSDGNLWISTSYGISKMDLNKETKEFINFYASDGLQVNEFSKNASLIDNQGRVLFGGISGITYFNPREIVKHERELKVRVTDFYIHNQPVKKGMKSGKYDIINTSVINADKFNLAHNDNSFSIEFSTMEFNNPEQITYTYSMGDEKWIKLRQGENRVAFNNLSVGEHLFKVRAEDQNTTSDIKQILITIHPVWYFSNLAKLIYFLIFASIVYFTVLYIRQRSFTKQKMQEHKYAEEINEAKLQFFINISHEIKTPISLITNPLRKLITEDSDKSRQQSYRVMYRNSERILVLLNQLMDMRKINKNQMSLKFYNVEIVEFITDIYSVFEEQAQSKQIELKFNHDIDKLDVWVDPKNFDKIILNILSNALKFTPNKGSVTIDLNTINLPHSDSNEIDNYFEIVISDTGVGIAESEIERIFERFYQIREHRSVFNGGTGIGLHIAQSLTHLHHGTLKAENNQNGEGSRFIIRLPLGNSHLKDSEIGLLSCENVEITERVDAFRPIYATPDMDLEQQSNSKTRATILVADDDDEIRRYIKDKFCKSYNVIECSDGEEAYKKALKQYPDLIISDVMMPKVDGITLCRNIKKNININHIPVVLLTAKSKEADRLEGLDIGADAYIIKPFNIEVLESTVNNIIKNREILRYNYSGSQDQSDKIDDITIKSSDELLLERVMNVINQNMDNPDLSVEMIANQVGISRVHLYRKLKELTNQSTRDFIRNVRLQQAANLLSSKHLTVKEVAMAVGFVNLPYFSIAFKELYGVSPTDYMERHLKPITKQVEQIVEHYLEN